MSKVKEWILRQQEIDSQDDPDMLGPGGAELPDDNETLETSRIEDVEFKAARATAVENPIGSRQRSSRVS